MHTQSPNRIAELLAGRAKTRLVHLAAHCDVDQSTAYRWMTGRTPIPDDQKPRVAGFFDVSVAYLMRWEQTPAAPGPVAA